MCKKIDISLSVYELIKTWPEIKEIMAGLGFKDILRPGMLETAGRFMTLKKGAKLKKIDFADIEKAFCDNGFELTGKEV